MIKTIAITVASVIIALIVFQVGKKVLGISSYEENYDELDA